MMFCVGIFQEPLALDVEIIKCTRSGKRSTIACYAWVSGPPVSPSRVRPGNMAEKPARHTSLPTIAVLLESFAKWILVRFHIADIPHICWEEGTRRHDDFIFFGFSKVYFCLQNMDSSKDSWTMKTSTRPQVVVHGEVYSVWSLLEAELWKRGQEWKTQDRIQSIVFLY